jgi:hypothetical protein
VSTLSVKLPYVDQELITTPQISIKALSEGKFGCMLTVTRRQVSTHSHRRYYTEVNNRHLVPNKNTAPRPTQRPAEKAAHIHLKGHRVRLFRRGIFLFLCSYFSLSIINSSFKIFSLFIAEKVSWELNHGRPVRSMYYGRHRFSRKFLLFLNIRVCFGLELIT